MLAHTLWRKLFPGEIKTADNSLNSTLYNLLRNQRWNAAVELGTFSLSPLMIKESSDLVKRIRVINTAIATKFTGNLAEAMQILDSVDWSASIREFKLACCVIKEEYEDAAKLMEEIGREGEMIEELAYYEWPLFKDFIGTELFLNTFKEIYGHPYTDNITAKPT